LAAWPEAQAAPENQTDILADMRQLRELITEGLDKREIKVRQPLASVTVNVAMPAEYFEILEDELNVKKTIVELEQKERVTVDTAITPELKLEGEAREIIRAIQEGRKKAGFNVEDRISLGYQGKEAVLAAHQVEIAKEVLAEGGIAPGELTGEAYTESVTVEGEPFTFWLQKKST
jgi:isoleucyl-tRNA synthetase